MLGRSDKVGDGVNNQGRKSRVGNPVKGRCDCVQGNDDDNTGGETRSRGAHTSLRLEGRSRERTGGGVRREKSTDGVVNTDSNKLLVRVNLITVQPTERFGNGDVLEKKDDSGNRNVGTDGRKQLAINERSAYVLQTRRDIADEGNARRGGVNVDSPRDDGPDDDDKGVSKRLAEESDSAIARVSFTEPGKSPLDSVKGSKCSHTESGVERCLGQVLESVDDNLVCGSTSVKLLGQTKNSRELASGDVKSTTSHETRDGRLRNYGLCQQTAAPGDSKKTPNSLNSTSHPILNNPIPKTMNPQMNAKAVAITGLE